MTLAERLRHALETGHGRDTVLLTGDRVEDTFPTEAALARAAVLVPVTDRAEPGVILTQRTDTLRSHAGQIAFPGGRIDPGDDGPIGAALRESHEEIGLDAGQVQIVGIADQYLTVTGFEVTPVIGVVPPDLRFVPNAAEVADVFEVPLGFVLETTNHIEVTTEWQGRNRHYYEINWEGRRIWGATAAMIVNLSRRLRWES